MLFANHYVYTILVFYSINKYQRPCFSFCHIAVKEISDLLNTSLDDDTLKICVQLLEAGVNAEALATVVMELRREATALKVYSLL